MPLLPDKILLTVVRNPFQPYTSRSAHWVDWVEGRTVGGYIREMFPAAADDMDLTVSLNRALVPAEALPGLTVLPGDNIVFCATPRGGGAGGKNILMIVAMIAVMVAAVYTGGAAAALYGPLAGKMVGAGVMMGGALLVNTLLKPQVPDVPEARIGSPTYAWDTTQNLANEGIPWPVVYGTCRVFPPLIGKYTELVGNKQYLNLLYAVADHALDGIGAIYINDTDIEEFNDVWYERRLGDTDQVALENFSDTIVDVSVYEKLIAEFIQTQFELDPAETLVEGAWSSTFTTTESDITNILVHLEVADEFYREMGVPGDIVGSIPVYATWNISIRYRVNPAGGWTTKTFTGVRCIHYVSDFAGTWLVNEHTKYIDLEIETGAADKYDFEVQLTSTDAEAGHDIEIVSYDAYPASTEGQSVIKNVSGSTYDELRVYAIFPSGLWKQGQAGLESVTVKIMAGVKVSGGSWVNQILEVSGSVAETVRRQFTFKALAHGTYQVRMAFAEQPPGVGDPYYKTDCYFDYYQTVTYDDFAYPGASLLAVRALSTDQLHGQIPAVSCVARRDYVSVGGADKAANNPAWIAYDMHVNDQYGYGVAEANMIGADFQAWANWCDDVSDERDKADDGTSTSVGLTFLTDSSKSWNVNAYKGYILVDSSDTWFEIASNTADTLTVSGTPAAGAYGIYSVADYGTATAGSGAGVIEDTGKAWTADQWVNYTVVDYDAAASYVITSNTETELLFSGGSGVNGHRYYIRKYVFQANIYFDATRSFHEAMGLVETLGWGRVVQKGTSYGVIVDRPGTPVQLFGIGNIVKDSFEIDYLREENRCNAIELSYYDEDNDYARQNILVHRQDYEESDDTVMEPTQIDLIGCTRRDLAIYHAQYMLAGNQLLKKVVTFEVDVDALAAQAGDLIYVSHDVPQWGYSGRVVSSTNNTVVIDRNVTMQPGTTYQIMIRHQTDVDADGYDDMETGTIAAVLVETTTATLTLAAGVWTNNPAAGAVYAFGASGALAGDYRIINISRAGDMTRKITALEYDEDVYTPDQALAEDESVSDLTLTSDLAAREYFRWDKPNGQAYVHLTWRGHAYLWHVWYKETDATTAPWTYWGEATDPEARISDTFLKPMTTYTFVVSHIESPNTGETVDLDYLGYGNQLPPGWKVQGLRVKGDLTGANIWTGLDLEVEWHATIGISLPAGEEPGGAGIVPPQSTFTEFRAQVCVGDLILREVIGFAVDGIYLYDANVLDTGGYPQPILTIKVWGILNGCETHDPAVILCTNEPPTAPATIVVSSRIGGAMFSWDENTEKDFASYFIRTRVEDGAWGDWENILTNSYTRGLTLAEILLHKKLRCNIDIQVFVEDKFYLYSGQVDEGTATDVGENYLEDTNQTWEVDEYADHILLDSTYTPYDITSNTADTLTVVGTPAEGWYRIQLPADNTCVANVPYDNYVRVTLQIGTGITGEVGELYDNDMDSGGVTVT